MKLLLLLFLCILITFVGQTRLAGAADPPRTAGASPADALPPHITRITWFGERADWSHDGEKIVFLSKTFGDVMEVDVKSKVIRNLTAHYPHNGYTRALYLANGDILISGPEQYDPNDIDEAREQCFLYVLDKSLTKPAAPLRTKCFEGPAASRKNMHIAWTHVAGQYPDEMPADSSRIHEADIAYEAGRPTISNQRLVVDSRDLPFRCDLETQNFRPPDDKELIFSTYEYQGGEVCGVNLLTKQITNYTNAPTHYEEPEGVYPDGKSTLVESDEQNGGGPDRVDVWKLTLDGSGEHKRLTFFSDFPGYKGSNPVVSDDGRSIAFQLGKSGDEAGVGYGIFVYDIDMAERGGSATSDR